MINIPNWLIHLGTEFATSFVAALTAHKAAHGDERKETPKKLTEAAAQGLLRGLLPDREDVVKELERLGRDGEVILRLLEEANVEHGGVIEVSMPHGGTKRYTENWVVNRLLDVKVKKDRDWTLSRLNRLCAGDRAAFMARLELLHNDWYKQYPRLVFASARDGAVRLDNALGPVAAWLTAIADEEDER